MRAVLDTNLIVSAVLSPTGAPALVLEEWRDEAFDLVVSESILEEYQRALGYERVRARHGFRADEIASLVDGFRQLGILVEPDEVPPFADDPADAKFLACAIAGGAEHVLSGEARLLSLREHQGIRILSPSVFLAVLEQEAR